MIPFTLCAFILVMSALYAGSGVGYQVEPSLWRAFLATAGIFLVCGVVSIVAAFVKHELEINFGKDDAKPR